jgi:hypothetical protein
MNIIAKDILQTKLDAILTCKVSMELPLLEESGEAIGVMRPLTESHLDQMNVIKKMTEWRNANMANFLTQFEASSHRTRGWVQDVLLKNHGQMLWLIYDKNDSLIGHFGFKNLTTKSVLLDNAIRGERQGGHPKLFTIAGKALVQWLWQETPVQRIDGIVMTDNVPAIMMNRQIGFQGWKRHPLIKRIAEGDTHWDVGVEGQNSPDDLYCFTLFIERNPDYFASN